MLKPESGYRLTEPGPWDRPGTHVVEVPQGIPSCVIGGGN